MSMFSRLYNSTDRSPCHDELGTKLYLDLAVLVYRLVCQPVTLESWVRFPDAAAKVSPPKDGWSPLF